MSWISKDHKILYSEALSALYNDTKDLSLSAVKKSGELVTTGYEKIKKIINNESSDEQNSGDDTSEDVDIYNETYTETKPDIIFRISSKDKRILKVFYLYGNEKRSMIGHILSDPDIKEMVETYFEYRVMEDRGRWYLPDGSRIDVNRNEVRFEWNRDIYLPINKKL